MFEMALATFGFIALIFGISALVYFKGIKAQNLTINTLNKNTNN